MAHEVVTAGGLELVGLETRASNEDPGPIGGMWQRVHNDPFFLGAPELIAVYCEYEGDHTQPYTFFLGKEGTDAPAGYVRRSVPAGQFARFWADGEQPATLIATWGLIWGTLTARRFEADYEVHSGANPSRVGIYVGV